MAPPRTTQHRSKREVQEVRAAEVQEFRAENQKLRRENARLRRELEKYQSAWASGGDQGEETVTLAGPATQEPKKAQALDASCIACGGPNVVRIKMGAKTLVGCKDCKHRFTE